MANQFIIRKPTATWTAENPTLLENQLGVESSLVNGVETDSGQAKLGDGVTLWDDLPYWNPSGVTGGVSGPGSSTDNAVVRFNGTDGATVQNSAVTVDDNGTVALPIDQGVKINSLNALNHDSGGAFVGINAGGVGTTVRIYGNTVFLGSGLVTYVQSNGQVVLASVAAPASAAATGTAGEIRWDTGFIYICTSANAWKRVAIATW